MEMSVRRTGTTEYLQIYKTHLGLADCNRVFLKSKSFTFTISTMGDIFTEGCRSPLVLQVKFCTSSSTKRKHRCCAVVKKKKKKKLLEMV